MDGISQRQFRAAVGECLAGLLGIPSAEVSMEADVSPGGRAFRRADLLVSAGELKFIVECKSKADAATVGLAVRQLKESAGRLKTKALPLFAVPYMGEVGRRLCEEAGVCWIDLSGNARLFGRLGLHVSVEGKPNRFKRPGRPRSVFAPKSSRIARCLLIKPYRSFTQRELARLSGLNEGFTSRIVRRLEDQRLVSRDKAGAVRVADYASMLEAWREVYDFSRYHIVPGHIAVRSSEELLRRTADGLRRAEARYAATGLAGAWLVNRFAGFRLALFYVDAIPSDRVKEELGFRDEARGGNIWLVAPNDEGVFHGAAEREGIRCVHPVQVYLDLKDHPERSKEAADELRAKLLSEEGHV